MFISDKLTDPITGAVSFSDVTGTYTHLTKSVTQNIADKDNVLVACNYSVDNISGIDAELTDVNCLQFTDVSTQVVSLPVSVPIAEGVVYSADIYITGDSANNVGEAIFGDNSNNCFVIAHREDESLFPRHRTNTDSTYAEYTDITMSLNKPYNIKFEGLEMGRARVNIRAKAKIANVKVGDYFYPLQEGSGTKAYDISGNGNHATITDATWSTLNGIESWNHEYGHDLVGVLNGTVSGFDTGIGGDELDMYEIKIQSTGDQADSGNFRFVENGHGNPSLFVSATVSGDGYKLTLLNAAGNGQGTLQQTIPNCNSSQFNVYKVDYTNPSSVKIFVNGNLELTSTVTVSPDSSHFHIGDDSSTNALDNGFFYYFKGWKNGVLKIHAVLDSSGRVKDLVSGNLLTADVGGTGSLGLKRIPALNFKTVQTLQLDGANAYFDQLAVPSNSGDIQQIKVKLKPIDSSSSQDILELFDNNSFVIGAAVVYKSNGKIQAYGMVSNSVEVTPNPDSDGFSTVTVETDGNNAILDVDGTSVSFVAGSGSGSYSYALVGLAPNMGNFSHFEGEIASILSGASLYTPAGGALGTATLKDVNGIDDGRILGGVLSHVWGTRKADDDGELVNADYATGNTSIRNQAGFVQNGSECGLKFISTGSTKITKSKADLDSHSNGTGLLYISKTGDKINKLVQYDTASTTLTSTEQAINDRYFGN